uniref:Peroxidase n=1 Tax=Dracaena sanderiana TaxID=326070 RepID=A0A8G1GL73_9ASPA|nr:peroxidase [Dracaena sanderiana]
MAYVTFAIIFLLGIGTSSAQLSPNFYSSSCPQVFSTIKPVLKAAIDKNKRDGASILRLFFHDCFVQGCDASVLLADTANFIGEQTAVPNNGSLRAFNVIDDIKTAVEKACPGVVSCADILAIASRDSVVILGGPNWSVKLGRRDSRTASRALANKNIPPPSSSLANLISLFAAQGLSVRDMVALSGGHTIGKARCVNFRPHIYNDADIDPSFAAKRRANCPRTKGVGDTNLASLDLRTPEKFDNSYYRNLINMQGLLHSDQVLYNKGSTDALVKTYGDGTGKFFDDFVAGMIKMGDVRPLTGSKGEIRKVCSKRN